jgi:hypothetical protein
VAYDVDGAPGGEVTGPAGAAREALALTRDEQSRSTVWHVFDRRDNRLHRFEQADFEHGDAA